LSIGIISFIAVAQLAPALMGGIYWKKATSKGAWAGILGGVIIWFYTLILPAFSSDMGSDFWVNPTNIVQIQELSPTSNAIIFSLLVNLGLFAGVSLYTSVTPQEKAQAELFVDVFKFANEQPNSYQSSVHFPSLKSLLIQFLGGKRTEEVLDRYARMHQIDWKVNPQADSRVIAYAERLLTEAIGPASARIMIASVVQEEVLSMQEVVSMLQESQEVLLLNKQLKSQSMQLQKLTSDLQRANDQLKAMGLLKDDFLYTVTHELRTPLTSIRAQAEILLDTDDITDEERNFFLSTIVKDCERLTRLITDVLDLEKFESGNQKMNLTFEQLSDLVQEAINSTQNLIKTKSIELKVDMPKNLPNTYLDRDRIIQVLVNLLSNAIKFCDAKEGKIGVSVYQIDNRLKVNVLDNGQGINPDQETRIFEKFYQVQDQLRLKPTGTGLGLAICKNIITHHLGSIYVKRVPEGTRFSFEIPIFNSLQHFKNAYENTLQKDFDRG
jgi:signal transduction histidine kinase